MERRTVIKTIGLIGSSQLLPAVLAEFLSGCTGKDMRAYTPVFFTKEEFAWIPTLIDIILPATNSGSASEANVHVFLDKVYDACIEPKEQEAIHAGLKEFLPAFESAADRTLLLRELDERAFAKKEADGWFRTFKKYTLIGFFTSKEGVTKASDYVKVPEAYKGDIPATAETLNYGKTTLHF
jgi:hypothetical protein